MTDRDRVELIRKAAALMERGMADGGYPKSLLGAAAALYDAGLLREPVEWRPISEAPDDGAEVLWHHPDFGQAVHPARGRNNLAMRGCTHWMPLPAPPKDTSHG